MMSNNYVNKPYQQPYLYTIPITISIRHTNNHIHKL